MEDSQIIELYHRRDEQAIAESEHKYGSTCRRIAQNILSIREDAEECVNDTWYAAWKKMPPDKPHILGAFLGRITRNLSISRWRASHAKKRYHGMEIMLSELDECIPDQEDVEKAVSRNELAQLIDSWLDALPQEDRILFIRRYWYGYAVNVLAEECGIAPGRLAQRMMRLRKKLKTFLEQEGVSL